MNLNDRQGVPKDSSLPGTKCDWLSDCGCSAIILCSFWLLKLGLGGFGLCVDQTNWPNFSDAKQTDDWPRDLVPWQPRGVHRCLGDLWYTNTKTKGENQNVADGFVASSSKNAL